MTVTVAGCGHGTAVLLAKENAHNAVHVAASDPVHVPHGRMGWFRHRSNADIGHLAAVYLAATPS